MANRRRKWSEKDLLTALKEIRENRLPVNAASNQFSIPRWTLRDYISKGINEMRPVGRKCILNQEQEELLVKRLFRLAEVGLPLTRRELCKSVFLFCKERRIENPFSVEKEAAGRKWCKLFLKRHPELAIRRAQHLNEARAQKLNKFIVGDYFDKLKGLYLQQFF